MTDDEPVSELAVKTAIQKRADYMVANLAYVPPPPLCTACQKIVGTPRTDSVCIDCAQHMHHEAMPTTAGEGSQPPRHGTGQFQGYGLRRGGPGEALLFCTWFILV